jgi:hypothetical protein
MAVPNRSQQIAEVARWLDQDAREQETVQDIAKRLVDGLYGLWTRDEISPPLTLSVGQPFKLPMGTMVSYVAWQGKVWQGGKAGSVDCFWTVNSSSSYGTLMPVDSDFWKLALPSSAKTGIKENVNGWKAGQTVSNNQRHNHWDVIATGEKCVLLQRQGSYVVQAESNDGLDKFFKRES